MLFIAFFAIPLCVKARIGVFLCSHGGVRLTPPWQGLFRVQEGKRKITDAQKPPRKSLETTPFFAKSSGSLGFPQVFPPFISLWPPAPPPPFFFARDAPKFIPLWSPAPPPDPPGGYPLFRKILGTLWFSLGFPTFFGESGQDFVLSWG